ncbi:MAG: twin transmembrane helix small protein [Gammaproteobacteria bacterium]|nr:twin transmembrane helix small protein [Gammaproteobacteria bacterium]
MFTKIIIISVMLLILAALGSGLSFLVRDAGKTNRTVKALTIRIALSILLFLFLLLSFAMGWLTPGGN